MFVLFVVDGSVDECVFEVFAFGEGADVALLVVSLVAHKHVVVLGG